MITSFAWSGCVNKNPKLFLCLLLAAICFTAAPLKAEDMLERTTLEMALDDISSGLAAKERGELNSAIKRFTHALNQTLLDNENRAIALNNRGNCYADLGDELKAMSDYNLALELAPNMAEVYFNRAGLFYSQAQYIRALADYEKAAAISPGLPQIQFNMSFAYARLGRLDEAVAATQQAIVLSPDERKYREQLAIWQEMAGKR